MLDYQNRMESLLSKVSQNLTDSSSMAELEKRFNNGSFFKHSLTICKFCDPAEMRIRKESVLLAAWIVENKFKNINQILAQLKQNAFQLSSSHETDNLFYQHVIKCLENLENSSELRKQFFQLSIPILNTWTEKIIRNGLLLSSNEKISNAHIQTLFLSALLHPLRQNVGSCFATAPAILIQQEQPSQFIDDLENLLNAGMLRRTFLGHEHATPISASWGPGILNKVIQIKYADRLWESSELLYCLASAQILDKKSALEVKEAELKNILFNRLKLQEGERISLYQLIKRILLNYYKLDEKDVKKPAQISSLKINEILFNEHSLNQPFNKYHQFESSFNQIKYSLINFHENPFLKTWEYTFASFGETQSQFYKWNLYISLGFDSKKPFSIASCIFSYLEEKLKAYEKKVQHHDKEYEQEFYHVKMLEKRVFDIERERVAGWAKIEYQNHLHELNFHRKTRDEYIDKSERLSKLLPKILKTYDELFPKYFQEVYDASMQEVSQEIFEDSPAGFRLLYKHGRQDPTLWTYISSKEDFITYLKEFFVNTEFEISTQKGLEEFKEEYSQIITNIIHLIQTDNFIYAAFQRICDRYNMNFPSHDLSKLEEWPYKPWSYISGGTMERLLQHYYKREADFTIVKQKVATETELLAFLIEAIRQMNEKKIKFYQKYSDRSMLMYSPVHAFIFKPGWLPLGEIWDKNIYSFTWIRDYLVNPQIKFLQSIRVTPIEVNYFLNTYLEKLPYFNSWIKENVQWPSYAIPLVEFRAIIFHCLEKIPRNLSPYAVNLEVLDSWIYECFPLIYSNELYSTCMKSIELLNLEEQDLEKAKWIIAHVIQPSKLNLFIRSFEVFEILKRVISIVFEKISFEIDWPSKILDVLRVQDLAMPKPLKFADTNWPYFNFSFTVNPATLKLELWRMNALGNKGFPMHQWERWFSEEKASYWGILIKPEEYTSERALL